MTGIEPDYAERIPRERAVDRKAVLKRIPLILFMLVLPVTGLGVFIGLSLGSGLIDHNQ